MGTQEKQAGVVKWFDKKKGYGFIATENGQDIFVHYLEIKGQDGYRELQEGDKVRFEIGESPRGQKAMNVFKV